MLTDIVLLQQREPESRLQETYVDRTETFRWQDAERHIRLMPLWQWLE